MFKKLDTNQGFLSFDEMVAAARGCRRQAPPRRRAARRDRRGRLLLIGKQAAVGKA